MPYDYDVFLSYASEDATWAVRLESDLTSKGLKVFRDKQRLDPGLPWQPALDVALEGSEHFLVLWTLHAKDSAWVSREIEEFRSRADSRAALQAIKEGRDQE